MKKTEQEYFFRYYDKRKWYKNLDGYLQPANRLKTICTIDVKPPIALFNKYAVFSWKKNVYNCWKWKCKKKSFKELKKTLLEQKYPKSLIEASIVRAKEIPLEILRQEKKCQKWGTYCFHYCIQSKKFKNSSHNKTKLW